MQRAFSTEKPLYQQLFEVHSYPFYLLVGTCLISVGIIFASWALNWALWGVGLLILAAWLPLVFSTMSALYRLHRWLALLYLLVVSQAGHMIEHLAQMVQIHILGWVGPKASGIIGALNVEWVHLTWSSWVLLLVMILLFPFRRNVWLWMLFIFAIYHEAEHIYIVSIYVKTHIAGNPGLLARGGLIGGGLPINRPDLHAIYAVLEEAMLIMIYLQERKTIGSISQRVARTAVV
ncbi:MAG TPA: hypothetical protein VKY19_23210 [Ktedonosporobacter sp.]|jgi:hypothetical protein|nr:hypothetical protein [Ktedonosporobacter sp.]